MAIEEAGDDCRRIACGRSGSGGWQPGHFLVSSREEWGRSAQGKKVVLRHCGRGDRGAAGFRPDQPIGEAVWSGRPDRFASRRAWRHSRSDGCSGSGITGELKRLHSRHGYRRSGHLRPAAKPAHPRYWRWCELKPADDAPTTIAASRPSHSGIHRLNAAIHSRRAGSKALDAIWNRRHARRCQVLVTACPAFAGLAVSISRMNAVMPTAIAPTTAKAACHVGDGIANFAIPKAAQ